MAVAIGSALAFVGSPAHAVGSTSITDPSGVDYDAGCIASTSVAPPGPNSYASPGGTGCAGVSTYDGNSEGIDLSGMTLESVASGQLKATWTIDGSIPPAGSTTKSAYDLPDANFVAGHYFALFQNKTVQTYDAYTACAPVPPRPTPVLQRFSSWKDGYHFFIGFSVIWDGSKWVHSARIGEYDPSPAGGLKYFELDRDDGTGWAGANVWHTFSPTPAADNWHVTVLGNKLTVAAPGVYKDPDITNCASGHFDYWFAKAGDTIANVKGLTATDRGDGYALFSDTTAGNSTSGVMNSNINGVAYTTGAEGRAAAPLAEMIATGPCHTELETTCPGGSYEPSDTYGPGPTCPHPTGGGAHPQNPTFTPDTACHDDDDPISRGSFRPELWNTTFGFTV